MKKFLLAIGALGATVHTALAADLIPRAGLDNIIQDVWDFLGGLF